MITGDSDTYVTTAKHKHEAQHPQEAIMTVKNHEVTATDNKNFYIYV